MLTSLKSLLQLASLLAVTEDWQPQKSTSSLSLQERLFLQLPTSANTSGALAMTWNSYHTVCHQGSHSNGRNISQKTPKGDTAVRSGWKQAGVMEGATTRVAPAPAAERQLTGQPALHHSHTFNWSLTETKHLSVSFSEGKQRSLSHHVQCQFK